MCWLTLVFGDWRFERYSVFILLHRLLLAFAEHSEPAVSCAFLFFFLQDCKRRHIMLGYIIQRCTGLQILGSSNFLLSWIHCHWQRQLKDNLIYSYVLVNLVFSDSRFVRCSVFALLYRLLLTFADFSKTQTPLVRFVVDLLYNTCDMGVGWVAQWLRHRPVKQEVLRSNPGGGK